MTLPWKRSPLLRKKLFDEDCCAAEKGAKELHESLSLEALSTQHGLPQHENSIVASSRRSVLTLQPPMPSFYSSSNSRPTPQPRFVLKIDSSNAFLLPAHPSSVGHGAPKNTDASVREETLIELLCCFCAFRGWRDVPRAHKPKTKSRRRSAVKVETNTRQFRPSEKHCSAQESLPPTSDILLFNSQNISFSFFVFLC